MATEQISGLVQWGQGLVSGASAQGFGLPSLADSAELKDVVAWARQVSGAIGGFVTLPAISDDADFDTLLGWAKSLDTAVRGYGLSLPSLPG